MEAPDRPRTTARTLRHVAHLPGRRPAPSQRPPGCSRRPCCLAMPGGSARFARKSRRRTAGPASASSCDQLQGSADTADSCKTSAWRQSGWTSRCALSLQDAAHVGTLNSSPGSPLCCRWTQSAKWEPGSASNDCGGPSSRISPSSSQITRSHDWAELTSWVIVMEVRPSVSVSRALQDRIPGGRIKPGRRLVQDHDGGLSEHGAGDGQPLTLAPGKIVGRLAEDGFVALGQCADETVGLGKGCHGFDLLIGGIEAAEPDVLPDRSSEQHGVLEQD